ncbi:hypothetical protein [Xylella fastidiosa]|nr:hypothetical protein [Xylella fastidiosa]
MTGNTCDDTWFLVDAGVFLHVCNSGQQHRAGDADGPHNLPRQ